MNKIAPCLWFDRNAMEAVELYISAFEDGRIDYVNHYFEGLFPEDFEGEDMPDGSVLSIDFELCGMRFAAINGGPVFHPNPSISFFVVFDTAEKLDGAWERLSAGGRAHMPLDAYPFSERFGWIEDRFGVSWQLALAKGYGGLDRISPYLLFTKDMFGHAEEAVKAYCDLFEGSGIDVLTLNEEGGAEAAGTVLHAEFRLAGQTFIAMDSSPHPFRFSEGVSLMVQCRGQEEIDRLWDRLVEQGQEQPCGWLKDRFGVSWQIVPDDLTELMDESDRDRAIRVNRELLKMTKIDVQVLRDAYDAM